MLQQRALHKYHSPGLWTNTCCSHQREGEGNLEAGKRRLQEEMGFSTSLEALFSFIYKTPFSFKIKMEKARCKTAFSWASILGMVPTGLSSVSTKTTFSSFMRFKITYNFCKNLSWFVSLERLFGVFLSKFQPWDF